MKKQLLSLSLCAALSLSLCTNALAFDVSQDSRLLELVNKTHTIAADYVPELTSLAGRIPVSSGANQMRPQAADACAAMIKAMQADGITACYAQSGYRSYSTQESLLSRRIAERISWGMSRQAAYSSAVFFTAPAGASEHQTGLAMDFTAGSGLTQSFSDTAAGKWLAEHSWEYGFVLRYEGEKSEKTMIGQEAWHYRYVGLPHAQIMREKGLCLEEYLEYLQSCGSVSVMLGDISYDIFWTDDTSRTFAGCTVLDISRDNAGGWIITTGSVQDPLRLTRGHWSEASFRKLKEMGVEFLELVRPEEAITGLQLLKLCGLDGTETGMLTREKSALLLAPFLPNQTLTRLAYQDLAHFSGEAFQAVQVAVTNGLFTNSRGEYFNPKAPLTWGAASVLAVHFRQLSRGAAL